jgi:hypothetical protein
MRVRRARGAGFRQFLSQSFDLRDVRDGAGLCFDHQLAQNLIILKAGGGIRIGV